ncbi:hypothetical protein WA577_002484 [Blastocystis sp. JDR]
MVGEMLCASFNHNGSYLACGFDNGFAVYQCNPFQRLFSRRFLTGGIGIIQLLDESNIIAVVGGGSKPLFSPNSVLIWNDKVARFVAELRVHTKVSSIRVTNKLIIVVTITHVYIFDLRTLKKIQEYPTYENSYGVVAANSKVFVISGNEKGSLRIISESSGVLHLEAHDNIVRAISLSDEGSLLATVSERGTLIRLYNVNSGEKYQILRRGVDKATVCSLTISNDEKYLICISDKQMLYLFAVSENINATSLTTIFTTESKSIAKLQLREDVCAVYMVDAQSVFLV